MSHDAGVTRRTVLNAVTGIAAAAASAPAQQITAARNGDVLPLTSTSGVFIPPRGRSFMKFSFDFPEPSVEFEGYQFALRVFTFENVYTMDRAQMRVEPHGDSLKVSCSRLVWAGGQQSAPGAVDVELSQRSGVIECRARASMENRIKSLAIIVRGIPRGRISAACSAFVDHQDNEVLLGYPFAAGDLNLAAPLTTPLVLIEKGGSEYFFISALDNRIRATRFYFQPGEESYRAELVVESEGWVSSNRIESPLWRLGAAPSIESAARPHYEHLEKVYSLPDWQTRRDAGDWLRGISLVAALHGMHYTGYVFNSFPKMLSILEWMADHIDPKRVLVFLPAWDGRYYWEYPNYRVSETMGGESGLRKLVIGGHKLGFRFMPMFGTNAANRGQAAYSKFSDAATSKIDGDRMDLNWVDWDNDRHRDGWLSYMNPGVDSWRQWLFDRISDVIQRFEADAYFLDIVGGWTNNPKADMHAGTRKLVLDLREKYPNVLAVGEMHYDALLEFIPLFQVFTPVAYPPAMQKYVRNFYHLSHPAPGRGSTGVHEAGFGRWNSQNLSMPNQYVIPTLTVVDDTFDKYRDQMLAVVQAASKWTMG